MNHYQNFFFNLEEDCRKDLAVLIGTDTLYLFTYVRLTLRVGKMINITIIRLEKLSAKYWR